jgi:two-component system NtrC family sensor kinase
MHRHAPAFPSIRRGLAGKLALCLVLSAIAIFTAFGYINLNLQQRASQELLVQSADRITDIIQRSTSHEMMNNDRAALYQVIRDMGSEPGIRRVRIFNKEGRITFSTDAAELGRVVDKQAEACYACHSQGAPLQKLARPDRARIFNENGSGRVLGMIKPIENQPDCSNAACHAHPASQRILGVIDANLSLASVDAHLAATQRHIAGFSVLAILLICAVSVIFIWIVMYKPIHSLIIGTHRVADGDLEHRLPVGSDDELGDLAASFNKMTGELAAAHTEITEWARTLEERVEKKTRELEEAHTSLVHSEKMASLGKLAATVAHEVNNPLFGILTYARLCMKDLEKAGRNGDVDKMRERLRLIEGESRRCGDLIRNLLTFARQAPQRREPQNVNELVDRAVALVRHQLELNGIELEKTLDENLPPVTCDAGQFQQIVLVLCVNAVEAMPAGGRLFVSTAYDDAADRAEVRVRDTGTGIKADVLPHIFDPFFTTKDDKMRTGLGLAVAHSMIEQHGGTVTVNSAEGQGSEFVVTFPRERLEPLHTAAMAEQA